MGREWFRAKAVQVTVLAVVAGVAQAGTVPTDGMVITTNTTFNPGTYNLPNGITIAASGITVQGNGTILVGSGYGNGLYCSGRANVTVKNLTIRSYFHGMHFYDCDDLTVDNCDVFNTPELPEGSIFLNIFDGPNGSYAHAMWFRYCDRATIRNNDVSNQQNGISLFDCTQAMVDTNYASYNTGWGIYFYNTDNSTVQNNTADYCTRLYSGWSGADAASFLIVYGSDNNQVLNNSFVGGGDGVFLAGATHSLEKKPNNNNYFYGNNCADSPNNGFEATFSGGNVFENNISDHSNYGYWLGYSYNNTIRNNRANNCHTSGIAIEHGRNCTIEGNTFNNSVRAIWLWTDYDAGLLVAYPEAEDSYGHIVRNNTATGNSYGLLSEADDSASSALECYGYTVTGNTFSSNQNGIRFLKTKNCTVHSNFVKTNSSWGLSIESSAGNLIYNNWVQNSNNVYANALNTWNIAKTPGRNIYGGFYLGGNYWSNYTGKDNTGDGLGDTLVPYTSGGAIQQGGDNLPLTTPTDNDADGLPDAWETQWFGNLSHTGSQDEEPDGLTNLKEYQNATNPLDPDTDDDGLNDGPEVNTYATDPLNPDTDNDGLTDGAEANVHLTDPKDTDTDNDGMPDGWEVSGALNPLVNDAAGDAEGDGLSNLNEYLRGTNPRDSDSDDDGLNDGPEVNTYNTNPADPDTDDDELSDGAEVTVHHTNPLNADSESDGMADGWEVTYGLNPLVNDASQDPDGDQYTNLEEFQGQSDPTRPWSIPSGGHALDFDGLDDYASLGNVAVSGRYLTLEAWVFPRTLGNVRVVDKNGDYSVQFVSGDGLRFVTKHGVTWDNFDGTVAIVPNQWTHVACVLDGAAKRIYVNGQIDSQKSYAFDAAVTTNPLTVGAASPAGDFGFLDGAVEDVRVWNVGRTAAQINLSMHSGLEGNEAGLVGYWNFDEGSGQAVHDLAGDIVGRLGTTADPDSADPEWVDSAMSPSPLPQEPVVNSVTHPTFARSDAAIMVTANISDADHGAAGVTSAELYYGYAWPFNGFSVAGTGPGGTGDGTWTFVIPAQGAGRLNQTLSFFLLAWDGNGYVGFNSNAEQLFDVRIARYGDADGDGDVDLADYVVLEGCLTGPDGGQAGPACGVLDADGDTDVDLMECAAFQAAFGS